MAFEWNLNEAYQFRVCDGPNIQPNSTLPPQPFTMATLIARANRQLHLSSESVSSCLQDLFQLGHITYPRTDSTRIDESALGSIADAVRREFGKAMLTKNLNKYKHVKKSKHNDNNNSEIEQDEAGTRHTDRRGNV